jgi:hypothetical protein
MDTQLQKITEDAQRFFDAYRVPRTHIQGLLYEAKIRGTMGRTTLKQAMADQERKTAVLVADVRQEETEKQLAEDREAEKARIRLNGQAKREEVMERERSKQAEKRDLQEVFSPFLAEGHRNAFGDGCFLCQLSYGDLQKLGALDSPESFLEFAKQSGVHGRPTWGEDVRPLAAERLATFKFLAPAWIRMGFLRP